MNFFKPNNSIRGKKEAGLILINVLVFALIAVIVTTAMVKWAGTTIKASQQLSTREEAFQVAEAGIDYYRWHLAHNSTDYKDGYATTTNGPFFHDFKDKDGNKIGEFWLTITPPPSGSTVVTVKSKGFLTSDKTVTRTIQTQLAIPSLAKYAVVANDFMNFGVGTEVFGPIHSNDGIHFDGLAHNIVTSAVDKFVDPDNPTSGGHEADQFGVYTSVSPSEFNTDSTPPTTVPNRADVFAAGRQFPVPAVDFVGITTDLSTMKTQAQANGRYFAASGAQGYRILFKVTGGVTSFDLYKVTSLKSAPNGCTNDQNETNWGVWSINNQTFVQNYALPTNGVIFVEDNVWVEGQINNARVTVAAGKFPDSPSTRKDIIVNNDLKYTNYNGTDVLSLIAQGNITSGLFTPDTYRIDAALVAQNGRIGRYFYNTSCRTTGGSGQNYYIRTALTLYGMLASNNRYGFAWGSGASITSGYQTRNITYDANLLYAPPPQFPLTSDQYSTISWQEVTN